MTAPTLALVADELEEILERCTDSATIGELRSLTIRLRGEVDPYRPDEEPYGQPRRCSTTDAARADGEARARSLHPAGRNLEEGR